MAASSQSEALTKAKLQKVLQFNVQEEKALSNDHWFSLWVKRTQSVIQEMPRNFALNREQQLELQSQLNQFVTKYTFYLENAQKLDKTLPKTPDFIFNRFIQLTNMLKNTPEMRELVAMSHDLVTRTRRVSANKNPRLLEENRKQYEEQLSQLKQSQETLEGQIKSDNALSLQSQLNQIKKEIKKVKKQIESCHSGYSEQTLSEFNKNNYPKNLDKGELQTLYLAVRNLKFIEARSTSPTDVSKQYQASKHMMNEVKDFTEFANFYEQAVQLTKKSAPRNNGPSR